MTHASLRTLTAEQTAQALPYPELVECLIQAAQDHAAGLIVTPTRQALPFPNGGTLLSMPATAKDIGVHKLVNVMPHNAEHQLPVIQGLVCTYDGETGRPLAVLDGPTVTERRTAAVSMMGIKLLWNTPKHVAVIGTGVQALGHVEALFSLYPSVQIALLGRHLERAQALIERLEPHLQTQVQAVESIPEDVDVVITVTSSSKPVYHESARADRLLIAVGAYTPQMAEIEAETVLASRIYVDEPGGAAHEAGDLLQAKVNWDQVQPIVAALEHKPEGQALLYKSVGCAAWDLAAARCAREQIEGKGT